MEKQEIKMSEESDNAKLARERMESLQKENKKLKKEIEILETKLETLYSISKSMVRILNVT